MPPGTAAAWFRPEPTQLRPLFWLAAPLLPHQTTLHRDTTRAPQRRALHRGVTLGHARRPNTEEEPSAFCFVPKHRRIGVESVPMRELRTLFGVWRGTGGRGACFRTGSRLVPRRKTARGSLFSSQGKARPEPSASHVGVTTPYRRDGPAASVPQAIGYPSPFRQTKTRQAASKRKLLNRRTQWIHGPAREGRTRLWCTCLGLLLIANSRAETIHPLRPSGLPSTSSSRHGLTECTGPPGRVGREHSDWLCVETPSPFRLPVAVLFVCLFSALTARAARLQ